MRRKSHLKKKLDSERRYEIHSYIDSSMVLEVHVKLELIAGIHCRLHVKLELIAGIHCRLHVYSYSSTSYMTYMTHEPSYT